MALTALVLLMSVIGFVALQALTSRVGALEAKERRAESELRAAKAAIERLRAEVHGGPEPPPPSLAKEIVTTPVMTPASPPPPPAPPRAAPPPPPPPRAMPVTPAPAAKPPFDWESLVGVKLFSWIAGIALVVAGLFFLKYSVERGWLVPELRMAIGLIVGAGLIVVCELKAARNYRVTANAMDGAGICLLFATFFAAHASWNLIGTGPTFALMALVTIVAVVLSLRRDSTFIALLGLVGGFATPAALSTGVDRPFGLFGYLLLLNAGLAWVAWRRRWPWLSILSVIFTVIYQWGWVAKFLEPGKLPIAIGIFACFPVLAMTTLFLARDEKSDGASGLLEKSASLASILPLVFGVFMAAVPAYGSQYQLLFGFLLFLNIGLAAVSIGRKSGLLHLAGAIGTLVACAVWLGSSYQADAWPLLLIVVSLFVLIYLLVPPIAERLGRPLDALGERSALAAPAMLFVFTLLPIVEPRSASAVATLGTLLALLAAIAGCALWRERASLYFVGAFFALAAELAWSVKFLDVERLIPALVVYGGFGLFHVAVPMLARTLGRRLDAKTSALALALSSHAFLIFVVAHPDIVTSPWPILAVLALLDLAIGAACLALRRGGVFLAALAASHVVLLTWLGMSSNPHVAPLVLASVAGVAALGLVVLGLSRRLGIEGNARFAEAAASGLFLAMLVGIACSGASHPPEFGWIVFAQCGFVTALLVVAATCALPEISVIAAAFTCLVLLAWQLMASGPEHWWRLLIFASLLHALFVVNPLVIGRRVGKLLAPHVAAVISSGILLWVGRDALLEGGHAGIVGLLPLGEAILMALLLAALLKLEAPSERALGRLATVAGATLALITVAIPMQLDKQWITVAWALEAAALAWLYRRIPHRGLIAWCAALALAVFVRLTMNPAIWDYHARGMVPIFNWYLYTYLVSAAALYTITWLLRPTDDRVTDGLPRLGPMSSGAATILLFLLLNIEIADFFSEGTALTFNFSAGLAQDLTYTLGWALFAIGLLIVGIVAKSKVARIASIVLLVVTVLKAFLHDLLRLGGLYRVFSFVGLAICLALVAVVFQRFVLPRHEDAA